MHGRLEQAAKSDGSWQEVLDVGFNVKDAENLHCYGFWNYPQIIGFSCFIDHWVAQIELYYVVFIGGHCAEMRELTG